MDKTIRHKFTLFIRLQFKDEELKRMAKDWEGLTVKEASLSKLQAETRTKLSDLDNREKSLKFREERITQEKVYTSKYTIRIPR